MAKKTTAKEDKLEKEVLGILQPIADGLKVAVSELWGIFVRQFVVKGLSELFTAITLFLGAYWAYPHVGWWALIPIVIGQVLMYDVINLLGNPKYYALGDITKKMSDLKKDVQ